VPGVQEVTLQPRPLTSLATLLPQEQADRFHAAASHTSQALAGRTVWNINSTATGGGVAEMLHTLLGYFLAAGVAARWLVLDGDAEFFATTKSLHNTIHGVGDPCAFGPAEHEHYSRVLDQNLPEILRLVGSEDLVLLHDPQSAGLVEPLQQAGVPVAWRSHIGRDSPNEQSVAAWDFLRRYVGSADAFVFSRRQHVPAWVPQERLWVIPPSIDPLSPKNRTIPAEDCRQILMRAGLLDGDGATGAVLVRGAPAPEPAARLVVQVSRWDRLKDMAGVMAGFAQAHLPADAHLMLAGPAVSEVSDDPEGADVLDECLDAWKQLPPAAADRVSLVSIPMDDPAENATIVNALQRHAAVLVQKSLAEGFGLTVAEAMWKERPTVASAVGGIQDQIVDGRDGLLVSDPTDLDTFGQAVRSLLIDQDLGQRLGRAGHQRVRERFLDDRHLADIAELLDAMLTGHLPERGDRPAR
jgi:trehalose synthase